MQSVDLNLLEVLDALLQEGSVSGAARRLHLSAPAISRSLGRLRKITGDPLFVRVGRNLVATSVADQMRGPTHDTLAAARDLLAPHTQPSDADLERNLDATFTIHTYPDAAEVFGAALLKAIQRRAPQVTLRFIGEVSDPIAALGSGEIDLEIATQPISAAASAVQRVHRQRLLTDTMAVVARRDGRFARACGNKPPTPEHLAEAEHVNASRRGILRGPLDDQLAAHGLQRTVAATAECYAAALALAKAADLVCLAPERISAPLRGSGLRAWPTPFGLPPVVVEQLWHQRTNTDPQHRWLRARVREAVAI